MTNPQLDRIEGKIDLLLERGGDPSDLAPPADFTATFDPVTRKVTSTWAAQADAVQYHESGTDPENTLKETLEPGVTSRESSELRGGHDYVWGACSVRGDEVSEFTPWITIYVPLAGEGPDEEDPEEPDEEDPDEPDDEEPPPAGGLVPSGVLDLRHWTVALDVGGLHDPDNDYRVGETLPGKFFVREDGGVVFRARAGGVTTKNSVYPRVECREMDDDDWNETARPSSVPCSLEIDLALDARGLLARPRLVGAQIHGTGDDVCQVMLHETEGLVLMHSDGNAFEVIDPDYVDGTRVTCRIVVVPHPGEDEDLIQVWYEGRLAAQIEARGSAWYFKFGCYLQSNPKKWGEDPDATGEVVVYDYVLSVGA